MQPDLATLIKSVPGQADVYSHDLAAARALEKRRAQEELPASEQSPREIAIDGVAHHVFNTLRGAYDGVPTKFESKTVEGENGPETVQVPVEWATFDEVRAIVAKARF